MIISELIAKLETLKSDHGDLEVVIPYDQQNSDIYVYQTPYVIVTDNCEGDKVVGPDENVIILEGEDFVLIA